MGIDEAILIMENERPHCGDKFTFTEGELCEAYTLALMALRDLPSVQSERKKGKWVGAHAYCDHLNEEAKANGKTERYLPSGMVIGVYCDQCWCRADKKSDFCPNCGVDMRGEDNE